MWGSLSMMLLASLPLVLLAWRMTMSWTGLWDLSKANAPRGLLNDTVSKGGETLGVGCAVIWARNPVQSLALGKAARAAALPPFLARPDANASADSVPSALST